MIRDLQARAWANKVSKDLLGPVPDPCKEFCLLQREVSEAFTAWYEGQENLGEELADVVIFVLGLAQMADVDLQEEVEKKMEINERRTYARLPNGTPVKVAPPVVAVTTYD